MKVLSVVLVLVSCLLQARVVTADAQVALSFGVVPQQSATKLARLWGPFLRYLGERSGTRLMFETAPDIPEFERRCATGRYDIAYMNPYHYTVFHRSPGYEAFARQSGRPIRGILVVRKDSPIHDLSGLAGATLAFPAPAAFAATVLTRAELVHESIPFTPEYVSSHDSVYRSVAKGLYPAGGGIERTLQALDPVVRRQLRVLWTSRPYSPHAFASHPRVPQSVVQKISATMQQMQSDETGRRLMSRLTFSGIEAADDAEWDDIRALDIDLLERLTRK